MKTICKENIKDNFGLERLFTEGVIYEFIPVDNIYSRKNDFIGYFVKDDTKHKRWCTKTFKEKYFTEYK